MRYLYGIFFRLFNWKFEGRLPYESKKYIIVVAPHTSNWDFILGVMIRSYLRLKSKYLGKASLFKPPFGFIFRWLGGYPVDRSRFNNLVEAVVDIFNSKEEFVIALAPEGTRSKVDHIKKGFYFIAKGANVPIVPVGFDFGSKTVRIHEPIHPDNIKEDFKEIIDFFSSCKGIVPENGIDPGMYDRMLPELED